MNRLQILDKTKCTGCGACQNICPRDAITMQWDREGFPYPVIDDALCIDCGRCIEVCPLINPLPNYGISLKETTVYAAWSNDIERRIQSTSGGIFSELALSVYDEGGVVVGAVYDEAFMIHHECSESSDDLTRLRQSKYAQSDIRQVFREIRRFLKQGRPVLFCGTPCQAAGLRAYLGGAPEKLLLCDFICRGINSPKAYAAYLEMLERKHGAKITMVQFKNKDKGWNRFHTKVTFENGSVHHQDRYTDPFMQAYLKYNLIIRPCCHTCQFKGGFRNVDMSLGDFWGVAKYAPELDADRGTSVVIASSEKGRRALEALDGRVVTRIMSLDQVNGGNPCLTQPALPGEGRDNFLTSLDRLGFEKAMRRFGGRRDPKGKRMRLMGTFRNLISRIKRKLVSSSFLSRKRGSYSTFSVTLIVSIFIFFLKMRKRPAVKALLFPTASPGNLGDEAVLEAFAQQMTARGMPVAVTSVSRSRLWNIQNIETKGFNLGFTNSLLELLKFLWFLSGFTRFYVWGADVMDGAYSLSCSRVRYQLANYAAKMGLKAKIFGTSFRGEIPDEAVAELKKLDPRVLLTCRGETSRSRLEQAGIVRRVDVYPDLAFSLRADASVEDPVLSGWLEEKAGSGRVLGVNLNNHLMNKKFGNFRLPELVSLYYRILDQVLAAEPGVSVVLIPHMFSESTAQIDDYDLCKSLFDQLHLIYPGRVYCLNPSLKATQLRKILGYISVVFTGKMHLAIAALSVARLPISVAYLDKFSEIYDQFGLDKKYIVSANDLGDTAHIASFLLESLKNADDVVRAIFPAIQKGIADSVKHLEP